METRAQDYDLPVNVNQLGCIMLDFEPLPVRQWMDAEKIPSAVLAYDQTGEQPWVKGAVAEAGAHVTLLYGLVSQASYNPFGRDREAGLEYRNYIDPMLEDLDLVGGRFSIYDLEVFENPAYDVVVARISSTVLDEANRRLRFLPHIDTFRDYKAHVTLAYVEKGKGGRFAADVEDHALHDADLIGKAINYGGELD